MNQELMQMMRICYDMCDYVEENGVVRETLLMPLKENLRQDFMHFILYLSYADDVYGEKERRFIKTYCGDDIYPARAAFLRREQKLSAEGYGKRVPYVLKYFVVADAGKKIPQDQYDYKKAKHLVATYRELGQVFIASHEKSDEKEIACLTSYLTMLDQFLKDYGLLSPDAKSQVTMPQEEKAMTTEEILDELNSLIGLKKVKEDVNGLINLVTVQKMREEMGIKTISVNKHMVFAGNPGTGKTTVARLLARVYKSIGVVSKGHLVEVDRGGLVSGYVGQTALKTQEVIDSALGGILFIDEAYALTNKGSTQDFGQEAVDTLLKAMEDHRDDLIVIVAGYTYLMEDFLDSNPGLRSRFNKIIVFDDYTAEEDVAILLMQSGKQDYVLSEEAKAEAQRFFEERVNSKTETYANARDVRNYLEKAITNQANRVVGMNKEDVNKDVLMTIEKCDLENITLG